MVFFILSGHFCIANAVSPSFNCNNATLKVEKTICQNDDLAQQDVQLNAIYQTLKTKLGPHQKLLTQQQLNFLKSRDACSTDKNIKQCVSKMSKNQIQQLHNTLKICIADVDLAIVNIPTQPLQSYQQLYELAQSASATQAYTALYAKSWMLYITHYYPNTHLSQQTQNVLYKQLKQAMDEQSENFYVDKVAEKVTKENFF